jgi:hypothetical protein
VFAIDNGVVAVRYELPLFDMLAAAACRTIDSLGSLNRYNYGIKNEWRFLNVVPLFDMFAAAACRTIDSLGSPNRYNYGILSPQCLDNEILNRCSTCSPQRHVERQIASVLRTDTTTVLKMNGVF